MAKKLKKKERTLITVYPSPDALRCFGGKAPSLNLALTAAADLIGGTPPPKFSRGEWNFLADVFNGGFSLLSPIGPATMAMEAQDAAALDQTDRKWDVDAKNLVEKLRKLSRLEFWFVVFAIEFFWRGAEKIDHEKDEWWTLAFWAKENQKE